MENNNPERGLAELVDLVKSWLPRRPEPINVSRDFWMPDHSCRVCYECDVQFTIFNRRHHCRHCGRIFCAKCTANSVPVACCRKTGEEAERVRVCNYCYKQWEHEMAAAAAETENECPASSSGLSPSLSVASLVSTRSSCTANSNSSNSGAANYTGRPYQHLSYDSGLGISQPFTGEADKQVLTPTKDTDLVADLGAASPRQFGYCLNRSDEDDDYGVCHSDLESQRLRQSRDYYGRPEVGHEHGMLNLFSEENVDGKTHPSQIDDSNEFQGQMDVDKLVEVEPDNTYECDASSSIYNMDGPDPQPVDFENNGVLWFPPDPENEEDEKDAIIFDEEEGEDAVGEFRYLRSSNSFGSGESRNKVRPIEEHKKAMKNVVDGHFRALVSQLLQVENLPVSEEGDGESWLEIITSLSWEVASLLKPDTSKGGGMDPGGYVKVKCLASGRRSESSVIRGVVCRKNLAHRRMKSRIEKPRLLILGGALEYQRVSNTLSSFDTLLKQEMDHLKMAVAKIDAHRPHLLLVEKSVSRFAQDYLLAKGISLVLNMKRPLLERIARCTGAQIISSIDHLSSTNIGHCDLFHVDKFFEEHGSSTLSGGLKSTKNLMFLEDCPKPFGCTVLLRGANGDELKKVKHVVQYGVFAAYHLALETSFLADEGASLPELPLSSPITVALPDKPCSIGRSISTIPGFTTPTTESPQLSSSVPKDIGFFRSDIDAAFPRNDDKKEIAAAEFLLGINGSQTKDSSLNIYDNSTYIKDPVESSLHAENFSQPQMCVSMQSQQIRRLESDIPSPPLFENNSIYMGHRDLNRLEVGFENYGVKDFSVCNQADNADGLLTCIESFSMPEVGENQVNIDLGIVSQDNNQSEEQITKEEFPPSPSNHQSILVSLSTRCVWKGTVCERAQLFRIKYYGSFDKPLGRFLRDHLFDQGYRCQSCDMPSEAHVHCYIHRQGTLTISVKKLPDILLPGERDGKIWMWHRCLRCPRKCGMPPETRRVVMSDAAWGLSFGKFLELSFSNHAAASRVASCGHSLHRDCLRFYGFGKMVACFRYASINVHSVHLPPAQLDFNSQNVEWIQHELHEVKCRLELLYNQILNAIQQISESRKKAGVSGSNANVPESDFCVAKLERILQKEKAEIEDSCFEICDAKKGQAISDILHINKLRRQLLILTYLWDQRLIFASGSESKLHEGFGNILKHLEKVSSFAKVLEWNSSLQSQKAIGGSISLPSDAKNGDLSKENLHPNEFLGEFSEETQKNSLCHQRRDNHLDPSFAKEERIPLSPDFNGPPQIDPLESGITVLRSLSDGQAAHMNLSDTLDAKWTGDNAPACDIAKPGSPSFTENATTISEPGDFTEHHLDVAWPVTPISVKDGESSKKVSPSLIDMPFQDFYCSINKSPFASSSLYRTLSEYNPVYVSLLRELEPQCETRFLLPVGMNGTVIPVFDDEPTSIISYALASSDYHSQMADDKDRVRDNGDSSTSLSFYDSASFHPFPSFDEISSEVFKSLGSLDDSISTIASLSTSRLSSLDPLSYTKALHVKVAFTDESPSGKVKYTVTCYYAKCFEDLRKICCPSETDFIRSLSRCKKWGAQGGKSNVFFAKSLDDRFIIKQVTKTELESFIKFAPQYFTHLLEPNPTCLAKILGVYQVTSKQLKGGKESKIDVLVMENLLFGRNLARLYDLKGSSRCRYNADSTGSNKVLLDQNLIESMPTSPIFVGNKAKRLLERAVWNDTNFLASVDVMDYSLLVGVDEERHELVLGIIDFMRQYTWDKHLETWVKASGILGGPKNASPTVISPQQYKRRFRKAMAAYFLTVPDQWSPQPIITRSQSDLGEDNIQQLPVES